MADWNKLKVVDLKAELKKRGLPHNGVKAALVARLEGAEKEDGAESETIQDDTQKPYADSATSPDTISPVLPSDLAGETLPDAPPPQKSSPGPANEDTMMGEASQSTNVVSEPPSTYLAANLESSQPTVPSDDHKSALPSVEPQEAMEDRQKRKRRSQSPPPSTVHNSPKRLRTDIEQESNRVVTTNEDATWVEKHNAVSEAEVKAESMEVAPTESGVDGSSGPAIPDTAKEEVALDETTVSGEAMDVDVSKKEGTTTESFDDSLNKNRDTRFKGLFTGDTPKSSAMAISMSHDSGHDEVEPERNIGPAIHPATSALYIRDIMRPLNQNQFKMHIATLAAPPGQDPDEDDILDFYIDAIKTHAFVVFANISAASRVRSALHDRIWPDEKTRKPLWIDFIPEESVKDWIIQEQESSAGGRGMSKKWEIFYEVDDDRLVTAHLQDAGSAPHSSVRKPSIPTGPSHTSVAPRGIDGAPTGPRAGVSSNRPLPVYDDGRAKLNELFKSTTTKPVLYWQPVSKELANRRLDSLEDAYSKDARAGARITGDVNRYTFEDNDVLVDRGVELIPGLRPPPGYRAPRPDLAFRGGRGGGRGGFGGFGGGRSSYDNYRGSGGGRDTREYGGRY